MTVGIDEGHEQGTVAVEVMVVSSSANVHPYLFLLSLTGQKSSGDTFDVYVGQVGTPDAVAVPFEAVMVAKVVLENVGL